MHWNLSDWRLRWIQAIHWEDGGLGSHLSHDSIPGQLLAGPRLLERQPLRLRGWLSLDHLQLIAMRLLVQAVAEGQIADGGEADSDS